MNKYNSGQGGKRQEPRFLGGRPSSDANYGPKKKFDNKNKPQNAGRGDRGNRGGGGRDAGQRTEMFQTVCSTCKKSCEVPFRPDGSKPVLCSECFGKNRAEDKGGFERRDRSNGDRPKRDYDAPRNFDAPRTQAAPSPDYKALLTQVTNLEGKVTQILALLEASQKEATTKPVVAVAATAAKKAPVKKAAPKKDAVKTAAVKKVASTKATVKKVAPKKTVIKKTVVKKAAPKKVAKKK